MVLASDRYPPELVLTSGLAVLLFAGVLTPEEAFAGLANQAVIALAGLYVLTASLNKPVPWRRRRGRLLVKTETTPRARLRISLVTAPLSAFLNNTPVVATMMPVASTWARRLGVSIVVS